MKIISEDSQAFSKEKEKIFNALCNFDSYKIWWPRTIVFKTISNPVGIIGAKIKIRPYCIFGFSWVITDISPNEKVVVKYGDGIYSGTGVWSLQKQEGEILVKFSIDIESNNLLIKIVDKIFNIQKAHKKMMKKVFLGLHEYLSK
jgi:hypothetical protein